MHHYRSSAAYYIDALFEHNTYYIIIYRDTTGLRIPS
jgi:hypothetical protein